MYTQEEFDTMKNIMVKEQQEGKTFSKPITKGIPAEYDVDRIKTNLELNKEVGNVFLRQRNEQELKGELERAVMCILKKSLIP